VNAAIIACATLEAELRLAMEKTGCNYPVFWLKAGDHNSPSRRKQEILRALDNCGEFDTVLLAMAFCGSAAEGIAAGHHTLILPRCPDCLTLFLGSLQRRNACQNLYLLTQGWADGRDSILREYAHCLETYGEKRTARIFRDMFRHYQGIGLITLPELPDPQAAFPATEFAENLGLPLIRLEGNNQYLEDLLTGNFSEDRFLTIAPGNSVPSFCGFTGGDPHV